MGFEVSNGIELWRPALFDPRATPILGNYYGMNGTSAESPGLDILVAQYFPVHLDATYDRIGVSVQMGAASGKARLGIYRDADDDGCPDELVLDAGEVDCSTAGDKLTTIDQHLSAGLYFLALAVNSAEVMFWMDKTPETPSPLGTGPGIGYPVYVYRASRAYGALPSSFPVGPSPTNDAWSLAMRLESVD